MILSRVHRRHLIGEVSIAAAQTHTNWTPNQWPRSALTRTHLRSRRVLQISGPEAGTFLQGLTSNDIHRGDDLLYTGFFTHRGRYLFDGFLWRDEPNQRYCLDVAEVALETVLAHIKRYRLRSKIDLEDISDRVRIENFTCPDPTLFQQFLRDLKSISADSQAEFDPRCHSLGVRCYFPNDLPQLDLFHAFASVSESALYYDTWQMMNGIPRHGHELIPEKTIPLEANLDLLNAIAFTKGCYLGQELIARSHFTGVIRKRIVPFLLSKRKELMPDHPLFPSAALDPNWASETIPSGANIVFGSNSVGKVLSNIGNLGIALIRLEPLFRPSSAFLCNEYQLHPIIPSYWSQKP